jgi:hypothetical protein
MTQALDWSVFEEKAAQLVRTGINSRRGMERLFQFVSLPAFDSAIGWEMFQNNLKPGAVNAARTKWLWREDFEKYEEYKIYFPPKLQSLSPTLKQVSFDVDGERIVKLMTELKNMRLPPVVGQHHVGCDGTSFELAFGSSLFLSSTFRWWVNPPNEWKSMVDLILPVIDWVEREMPTQ